MKCIPSSVLGIRILLPAWTFMPQLTILAASSVGSSKQHTYLRYALTG